MKKIYIAPQSEKVVLNVNGDILDNHFGNHSGVPVEPTNPKPGIRARAFRTYPSLVRDVYFNKYIEERLGMKCRIIYNTRLDIEEGIDLMIVSQKNNYGISFFTDTNRAFTGNKSWCIARFRKIIRQTIIYKICHTLCRSCLFAVSLLPCVSL